MGVNSALRMLGKLSKNADEVVESGSKLATKGNVIKNTTSQMGSNLTKHQARTMQNAGSEMVNAVRNEPKRIAQNVVGSKTANAALNNHNSNAARQVANNMAHPEVAATSGNFGGYNNYHNKIKQNVINLNRQQRGGGANGSKFVSNNNKSQHVANLRNQALNQSGNVINNNTTANVINNVNNYSNTSNAINTLNNAINNTNGSLYQNTSKFIPNNVNSPNSINLNNINGQSINVPNGESIMNFDYTTSMPDVLTQKGINNTKQRINIDNVVMPNNTVDLPNVNDMAKIGNTQGQNIDNLRNPQNIVNMNTFNDANLQGQPFNLSTLNQNRLKVNEIDDAVNFAPDNREPLKFNFDGVKGFADEYLLGGFKDTYKAFKNGGDDMTLGKAFSAGFQNDDGSMRWGRVAGAYVTASAGLRLLSGGGLTHDRNGNPNLIGVPFV